MKKNLVTILVLLLLVSIFSLAICTALAQSGGYDLSWYTVDAGGTTMSGGSYTISGTSGQADAGNMNSGQYTVIGGFWGEDVVYRYKYYFPIILKRHTSFLLTPRSVVDSTQAMPTAQAA